jgi:hypothetical protein
MVAGHRILLPIVHRRLSHGGILRKIGGFAQRAFIVRRRPRSAGRRGNR